MKQDELFQLGKIVRTFGTKGEVIFQIDSEILSRIKKLESVYLKINENLVPFFIELLQPKAKGQALVKFLDVDSTDESSLLSGCDIFIPIAQLPKQKGTQLFSVEIEGYTVIDAIRGETGTVRTVLEMPQPDQPAAGVHLDDHRGDDRRDRRADGPERLGHGYGNGHQRHDKRQRIGLRDQPRPNRG